MLKLKCVSCHEEHPNWIGIDATVRTPSKLSSFGTDGVEIVGDATYEWVSRRGQLCLEVYVVQARVVHQYVPSLPLFLDFVELNS
jgi:hypothetical protein